MRALVLCLVVAVCGYGVVGAVGGTLYGDTVASLYDRVIASQMTKTEPFIKPFHWQEQKGIFPSDVLFNLHGRPVITATRRALDTPDVNAFVTLWVMNTLLEAHAIGAINLDQDVVQNAVTAIVDYQDKNYPDNMRQTFWPQKLINGTWVCNPENVLGMCDDMEGFAELVLTVLEDLDILPFIQAMTEIMIEVIEGYRPYFPIPADFDDSFTNVGFGNFLLYLASDFPQAQKAWASANENPATLWEPTLKYSYQPFSSDFNLNSIDPRTYYFAHEFLEQLSKNESFVLPTTWISNIDENRELFYEEVAMPFNVNNVDASVTANVLYGLTSQIISSFPDISWFSSELQGLYLNTSSYIAWTIDSNMFATRPDLGLLYYPDPYAFIWFVSRTERLLSDLDPSILAKLPSVVIQAHDMLSNSLHGAATAFLLSTVTSNETTKVYWEQWLGAADKDKDGNLEPHGDDRLFTTGAAINDLINIWTKKAGSGLQWKDDAPSSVQSLVAQAAAYLNSTVLNPDSLYYNAFFSGSVKGQDSLPYAYPATFMQYLNGTDLPPNPSALYITTDLIIAMQGCPSAEDYQSMVDERHFEYYKTPVQFDGFNAVQIFPFWSAAPLTMSIDLLALAKVGLIIN